MHPIIDEREFERGGIRYRVVIEPDEESRPSDYDCYSDADAEAFRLGHWQFVVVRVGLANVTDIDIDLFDATVDNLGGVEWGDMPGDDVPYLSMDYYLTGSGEHIVTGLMGEARDRVRMLRDALNALPLD